MWGFFYLHCSTVCFLAITFISCSRSQFITENSSHQINFDVPIMSSSKRELSKSSKIDLHSLNRSLIDHLQQTSSEKESLQGTALLPDSILSTSAPDDINEQKPNKKQKNKGRNKSRSKQKKNKKKNPSNMDEDDFSKSDLADKNDSETVLDKGAVSSLPHVTTTKYSPIESTASQYHDEGNASTMLPISATSRIVLFSSTTSSGDDGPTTLNSSYIPTYIKEPETNANNHAVVILLILLTLAIVAGMVSNFFYSFQKYG